MKTSDNKFKGMSAIKCLVFTCIISADNDRYDEDTKQEIMSRFDKDPQNWDYVLDPLGEDKIKLIELFEEDDRLTNESAQVPS